MLVITVKQPYTAVATYDGEKWRGDELLALRCELLAIDVEDSGADPDYPLTVARYVARAVGGTVKDTRPRPPEPPRDALF